MKKIGLLSLVLILCVQNIFAWGSAARDAERQSSENPTYFLGDKVYFHWDVDHTGWVATYKKAGIGTTNTSSNLNWQDVVWVDEAGDEYGGKEGIKSAEFLLSSVGTWYYSLWLGWGSSVGDNGHWYNGSSNWGDGSGTFISSSFTVSAINNPSSQTATAASSTQINLSWSKDAQNHNVMIVRYPSTSYTTPTNGTSYSVGNLIGAGTVVYNSNGTTFNDTGLSAGTTYYYVFYSNNGSYYSSGVTANATTKVISSLYYRSNGNVSYTSATNWETSTTESGTYIAAAAAPSGVTVAKVTVQSGHTLSVSTAITTPVSANFIVNGTLQLQSGGSVSTAPTYGASSLLKYNDSGTRSVGTEWSTFTDTSNATDANVPTAAGVGNPANVEVASGTVNETLTSSYDKHLYVAGNFVVKAGATMSFHMKDTHVSSGWATKGLIVGDSIINYGAVSTTTDSHQAYQCGTFVNESTGTWYFSTLAAGNDIYTSGDFINNNNTFDAVNINGRALILYGSKNPQIIGGTSTQTRYDIDYLIISKDAGTVAVCEKNLYCSGYANGQAGGGAITVNGGILDLSDRTVQIADNQANNFSTITTGTTGYLRTNSGTKLYILGNETTKNTGTLRFDQTTPGTTNVIGVFRLNRSNAQAQLNVLNDFVVSDSLKIQQGKLNGSADIRLDVEAKGTLSSTLTSALTTNTLTFTKDAATQNSAEFYKNSGTLTLNSGVRTLVKFPQIAKWNFVSFPYAVSSVKKSDGSTNAVLGTDYSLGEYDPALRATNVSGWKTATDNLATAGKGYIINKKNVLEDLYFVGSVAGTDAMFSNTASKTLTYTTSTTCPCNAGWNFIAFPMTAAATPTLTNGQFAYNYDPTADTYKLWYWSYNAGYTYGTSVFKPFTAFFVKTADASNVTLTHTGYSTPQGVSRKVSTETQSIEEIIPIYLTVNSVQYETLVRVMPIATTGQDELYDAPYSTPMSSSTPRLYSLIDGVPYSLNSIPEGNTIPVGLRVPAAGNYTFSWDTPTNGLQPTLTDSQTGTVTDMTKNTSYDFNTSVSGDINTRFLITVPKRVVTNVDVTNNNSFVVRTENNKMSIQGINYPAKVSLYDVTGKLLQINNVNSDNTNFEVSNQGVYILQISDKSGNHSLKVVVH